MGAMKDLAIQAIEKIDSRMSTIYYASLTDNLETWERTHDLDSIAAYVAKCLEDRGVLPFGPEDYVLDAGEALDMFARYDNEFGEDCEINWREMPDAQQARRDLQCWMDAKSYSAEARANTISAADCVTVGVK